MRVANATLEPVGAVYKAHADGASIKALNLAHFRRGLMRTPFLLVVAFGLALAGCATMPPIDSGAPRGGDIQHLYKSSYLRVEGSRLVAANGQPVALHGINIGGWLVTEAWMSGFTDSKDTKEVSGKAGLAGRWTAESLEERFGPQRAATLINAWQDHWITDRDLDLIRDSGFNLIRVPISYRTLQRADGNWILDARGQIDFSRMDWIVHEAARRGIYTIFDLHVWPEQRLDQDKIGRADGENIRAAVARLWTAIAAHYRGNGAIAAFDLINEFPGAWGVQQVLSHAVRNADPDRVQVIGGFTFAEFAKLHAAGDFPNSIFSEHLYGDKALTTDEFEARLKEMSASPVPVYIGEFLAQDFAGATKAMDAQNMSWSPWTYKAVDMGDWAIFNYYSELKTDIQHDSYEDINAKWSRDLTQWQIPGAKKNYFLNENRRRVSIPGLGAALLD